MVKVLHEAVKVEGSKDEERKGRQEKENVCARCGTRRGWRYKHTPWLCVDLVQCVDNGNHCLPSMQMNIYSFSKLLHVVYVHELTSLSTKTTSHSHTVRPGWGWGWGFVVNAFHLFIDK